MRDKVIFIEAPENITVDTPDDGPFVCVALGEDTYVLNGEDRVSVPQELKGKTAMYQIISLQYHAWKNLDFNYYGFCKNNKLFSFAPDCFETNPQKWVWFFYLKPSVMEKLCLNEKGLQCAVEQAEFLITEPYEVPQTDLWDHYLSEEFPLHKKADLTAAYEILCQLHPEDKQYADQYLRGRLLYPDYMFLASKSVFHAYSQWLFPILFQLEQTISFSQRSCEGMRVIYDIGVYMLGIFYCKLVAEKQIKTRVVQRAFIEFDRSQEEIFPAFAGESTAVLLCSSNYYAPYCATTIQSIIDNARDNHNYDIVIFQQDMTRNNMDILRSLPNGRMNFSIRFFDPRRFMDDYPDFEKVCTDFGVTRFPPILAYRAFAPYILKSFPRIIWLDCDLVFEHDIAELYETDMEGRTAAFVHDIIVCGFANGSDKNVREYYAAPSFMKDVFQYGNGGVVMLDMDKCRDTIPIETLLDKSGEMKHKIPEQDTINGLFEGKSLFLDRRWNVFTFGSGPEWAQRFFPKAAYEAYLEARKDPYVVHYVGPEKPWDVVETSLGEHFWHYARRTPYYETILLRFIEQRQKEAIKDAIRNPKVLEIYPEAHDPNRSSIRKLADRFFPHGSRRREFLKKLLPKKGTTGWYRMKRIWNSLNNRDV